MIVSACTKLQQRQSLREPSLTAVTLDFQNCGEELDYSSIKIEIPEGYELKKVDNDYGFCEYRLNYKEDVTFYVSSNIYSGSKLNYENRLNIGVETYSVNRIENDTIVYGGKQGNSRLWKEFIVGSYVVGYVNAIEPEVFEQSIQSLRLSNEN